MKKTILAFIFFIAVFVSGCNDDVEIAEHWTETMVIYGLLDVSQMHQYIKINKGFIGKGDANEMAKISDSTNYNPADLDVKLQRFYNGVQKGKDFFLHDTIIPNAQQGTFSKDNNIIFTTSEKLYGDSEYKLFVTNKKTGLVCSSSTKMIDKILLNIAPPEIIFANTSSYISFNANWYAKANSKLFQLSIYFLYKETKTIGDTVFKSLKWEFPLNTAIKTNTNEFMVINIEGKSFYNLLHNNKQLFPQNGYKRFAQGLEFHLVAGGEEFSTYYDVYKPASNTDISNYTRQDKSYTNIKNGIGIFSCRYNAPVVFRPFSYESIYELVNGNLTNDLGFLFP